MSERDNHEKDEQVEQEGEEQELDWIFEMLQQWCCV